ncbi:MAG: M61 family metallopeptidase [Okeania sp. SIO3I5]|uniref:M61 family metallopeptidase n=1 Tax=Okeania sp. SIO3I5 TaxID=2607805 RepID=UPI0013BAE083|nr:M61 family metallopeptidase [Okeania sp. SIO3I5]NEQ37757.1 M61 family metallopeptidase [Okeania sp. SIO3I5]
MTEARIVPLSPTITTPAIQYKVSMPHPESHLFEVSLSVKLEQLTPSLLQASKKLDLKMPVWTPGSYLVREYAKHLQDFCAYSENERPLPWQKFSKNHWQIETLGVSEVIVQYRIFANELTVRTNHLDSTHGYFNGAALFFYIPECEKNSIRIKVIPPKSDWQVSTSLPRIPNTENTFEAEDFDTLVDSPFEIGNHQLYEFNVQGKKHQLAIWGKGNAEPEKLIPDIQKIIEVEAEFFGGLPYEEYLFLLHISGKGFGGLEHKFSCTLNYPRFSFRNKEKRARFMQLVAHEFFHLWNVKRIRPKALEVFDYERENYTPSLWFCEGTTSYYDLLIPLKAGIYDVKTFLKGLGKEITLLLTTIGRKVQPVSESSWDAWIKLYRRDANSNNCQISYYLKGAMISLLLDLLIREKHQSQRSLDDVMRQMWHKFGKSEIGFTPEQLKGVIEEVAELDLGDFFKRYIDGVDELPFDEYLRPFGLQLKSEDNEWPDMGMNVVSENGKEIIKFVANQGPAQLAGLDAGDELVAIDGFRVNADKLSDRLKDYQPGDVLEATVFHQDELITHQVILAHPSPSRYQVVPVKNPTAKQEKNFAGWLGVSLESI